MSKRTRDRSTDWHEEARELRAKGLGWAAIGDRVGKHWETVRYALDPDFRAIKAERNRLGQRMRSKIKTPKPVASVRRDGRYKLVYVAPNGERKWEVAPGIVIGDRSLVALGYAPAIEMEAR